MSFARGLQMDDMDHASHRVSCGEGNDFTATTTSGSSDSERNSVIESLPLNLLPAHANPASSMTLADLDGLRASNKIPEFIETRLPLPGERVDWHSPGWEPFYEKMFDCGFRFPVMGLLRDICVSCKIHPSQLNPNTIRTLFYMEFIRDMNGLVFRGVDFFELYFIKGRFPIPVVI